MIVRKKPQTEDDLREADQAWFDSNADDNITAIKEIDAEAAKYGLVRTREYWLQQFTYEGQPVFRGFCFRLEPADIPNIGRCLAEARQNDVVGVSSVQIIREMRDAEV